MCLASWAHPSTGTSPVPPMRPIVSLRAPLSGAYLAEPLRSARAPPTARLHSRHRERSAAAMCAGDLADRGIPHRDVEHAVHGRIRRSTRRSTLGPAPASRIASAASSTAATGSAAAVAASLRSAASPRCSAMLGAPDAAGTSRISCLERRGAGQPGPDRSGRLPHCTSPTHEAWAASRSTARRRVGPDDACAANAVRRRRIRRHAGATTGRSLPRRTCWPRPSSSSCRSESTARSVTPRSSSCSR